MFTTRQAITSRIQDLRSQRDQVVEMGLRAGIDTTSQAEAIGEQIQALYEQLDNLND